MEKPNFNFPPVFKKLKRGGPAIVLPKDSGAIIAYSGIDKNSIVVEAGAGSGFLTIALANVAKKIISYENDERFVDLAKENVKRAGIENVEIKKKNILDGIEEKDVDTVVLDMRESVKVILTASKALKKDGYCVAYLPNIEQAKEFYLECKKLFQEVFMLETIIRNYEVRDFGVRPSHFGLMHTAYLVFARK